MRGLGVFLIWAGVLLGVPFGFIIFLFGLLGGSVPVAVVFGFGLFFVAPVVLGVVLLLRYRESAAECDATTTAASEMRRAGD